MKISCPSCQQHIQILPPRPGFLGATIYICCGALAAALILALVEWHSPFIARAAARSRLAPESTLTLILDGHYQRDFSNALAAIQMPPDTGSLLGPHPDHKILDAKVAEIVQTMARISSQVDHDAAYNLEWCSQSDLATGYSPQDRRESIENLLHGIARINGDLDVLVLQKRIELETALKAQVDTRLGRF
jgi:hypothetical protein